MGAATGGHHAPNQLEEVSWWRSVAELFSEQAAVYAAAQPVYPKDLFAKLAALTDGHRFAWDVGTGNGQAAIGVAEHYDKVVATDPSADQLRHAVPHPKVRYLHTADTMPEEELAVPWFDLPAFYAVANRVLRKPEGVIAVWGYNYHVIPVEDMLSRFFRSTLPYRDPRSWYLIEGYRNLPSTGAVARASQQDGVDLLDERVVKEPEEEWGGPELVRKVTYKAFLLTGTPRPTASPSAGAGLEE
ncbi:hypothetical protein VPH35_017770 [Triticum aestivum]